MLQDWTDEQLNLGIAVMSVLTFLALLIILALWVSPSIAAPVGLAPIPPTPTPRPAATLPPTWTPQPTETGTATRTPRPTETSTPIPTETPTATATTDVGATLTAMPTDTATPEPPPVSSGGGGGGNSGGSSAPPPPPPPPTATPTPLYLLQNIGGRTNCNWVGFYGVVYQADGRTYRPGVTVRVFNEFGYEATAVTQTNNVEGRDDANWEIFVDSQPREGLAVLWHLVLIEDGERVSQEYAVQMAGSCAPGQVTEFRVNWQRSVP